MGTIGSRLSRSFINWNAENRAHKVISQPKPKPAPSYPSIQKQKELVDKLHPNYKELVQIKDKKLDEHLKQVYVNSNTAELPEIDSRYDPNRPLPRDKNIFEGFEFGFYEPVEVKSGRLTLRQSIEMIARHNNEPEKYTVEIMAAEYKLPQEVVENILEFFQLYNIHDRQKSHNRDSVAMPLPISLKSGITVPHTIKPKKRIAGDLEITDERKQPPIDQIGDK